MEAGGSWQVGSGRTVAGPIPILLLILLVLVPAGPPAAEAQSLRGSPASLDRQNAQAQAHDFTYLETARDVRRFVEAGYLVRVPGNQDYRVHNVSFPYARPEVRLFIERLAQQYRSACGERLVVTSLTRPRSNQPPNASSRSVHPTGMAIDLRVPQRARCRNWLESTLLSLEGRGMVEAIRERRPPHYHVAVFPEPYRQYVARITGETRLAASGAGGTRVVTDFEEHRVQRGENLIAIARRYDTTVSRLRAENGLRSDRIMAGQTLRVPVERTVAAGESASGSGEARTHRVQSGESLWAIARRYGTTVNRIQAANGLSSGRILPGQELTIPGGGQQAVQIVEHRVRPGESLWAISRRHGVSVDRLRTKNGLQRDLIQAGQVINIPVDGR